MRSLRITQFRGSVREIEIYVDTLFLGNFTRYKKGPNEFIDISVRFQDIQQKRWEINRNE